MSIASFKLKNVASEIFTLNEGQKLSKSGAKLFNSPNVGKDIKNAKTLLNFIELIKTDPLREFNLFMKPARCHKITSGKYNGYYSARINKQLRVCFRWGTEHGMDNNAYDVEINKHYGDRNS